MGGSPVTLVADNQDLADAIQSHLKRKAGPGAFLCRFGAIRRFLHRDADGLLLLAAANPAEALAARRLVREISLEKWPLTVFLVEGEELAPSQELAELASYVAGCLNWPRDKARLADLVEESLARNPVAPPAAEESLVETIRRRLLAHTPSLLPLVKDLALAASHDVTVMLSGETGTGKTYLARLMHDCSPRKGHPFLAVSCGALPANLIENAFFGHVKGAFTGADRDKEGKFAAAGRGTILLDEIDTLGLEQQAGLLRVLETGEYEPVGSNQTRRCQARIIVASNWDLEEAVEQGKFRQDLYYRLHLMAFHLPPLRERRQDIAPLVRGMAARFSSKFRKDLFDVSPELLQALASLPWPGNIRQLENALQQAVLMSHGPVLELGDLPQPVRDSLLPHRPEAAAADGAFPSLVQNRDQHERALIQEMLEKHNHKRARVAKLLGISRVALWKKMKKYGLMGARLSTN